MKTTTTKYYGFMPSTVISDPNTVITVTWGDTYVTKLGCIKPWIAKDETRHKTSPTNCALESGEKVGLFCAIYPKTDGAAKALSMKVGHKVEVGMGWRFFTYRQAHEAFTAMKNIGVLPEEVGFKWILMGAKMTVIRLVTEADFTGFAQPTTVPAVEPPAVNPPARRRRSTAASSAKLQPGA